MIELSHLSFKYPQSTFQLKLDHFELQENTSLGIIGPSGSGKTTLLNLLSGILPPDEGTIVVADQAIHELNKKSSRKWRLQNVGFVFQDFRLFEYLSVRENILLPLKLSGKYTNQSDSELLTGAEAAGIVQILNKKPESISQGEKQRACILRALVHQPKIVLADEPTGNLDPENKEVILKLLLDFSRQNQSSLIAVTHDHSLLHYFDEIMDFKNMVS